MPTAPAPDAQTATILPRLIAALEDKKAGELKLLHVGAVSGITDYLVLATGNSEPHLRALRIETEKVLDAARMKIAGMEQGGFNSGWTVVDAYQIMVHLFTAEQRGNYALEKLWNDAVELDLKTLAPKSAPAPKVAKVAKPKKAAFKPTQKPSACKKTSPKTTAKKSAPKAKPGVKAVTKSASKPTKGKAPKK